MSEVPHGAVPGEKRARRWPAIVFAGPLVGVVAMVVMLMVAVPPFDDPDFLSDLPDFLAFVLVLGYLIGLLPSVVAALVWRSLSPRLANRTARLLAASVTGAIVGGIGVWPASAILFGVGTFNLRFYLAAALCGAIALVVTARPWDRP